jgi:hypothetical protein
MKDPTDGSTGRLPVYTTAASNGERWYSYYDALYYYAGRIWDGKNMNTFWTWMDHWKIDWFSMSNSPARGAQLYVQYDTKYLLLERTEV